MLPFPVVNRFAVTIEQMNIGAAQWCHQQVSALMFVGGSTGDLLAALDFLREE